MYGEKLHHELWIYICTPIHKEKQLHTYNHNRRLAIPFSTASLGLHQSISQHTKLYITHNAENLATHYGQ